MANQKNQSKTFKAEITKIENGYIYTIEGSATHYQERDVIGNDSRNHVLNAAMNIKENETYAVTITVTKIK